MRNKIKVFRLVLPMLLMIPLCNAFAQVSRNKGTYSTSSYLNKGVRAPNTNFTGMVWLNMLVAPEDQVNSIMGKVTFEDKARTHWHAHRKGQVLIVTEGEGYYQEKGKPILLIKKGDVVKIPPNTDHWHGASSEHSMSHIAIVADVEPGSTDWFKPVTDEEYNTGQPPENKKKAIMYLTDNAHQNHEELWPDYKSKAMETDPELITVFDNFAFDDVISHDTMGTQTRVMMIMASSIASHALTEYRMMVNAALNVGVTPVQVKEILYQSVPYVGISKVIDFINATNEIFAERNISLPLEGQSTTDRETRKEKGLAKQKEIFGNQIDTMYKNSPKDLLHIQEFLSANCFGDYMTRNGLDTRTREMATLSFLMALGGTESQMKGHIQGNLNVGNSRQDLISLMTQLLPYIGYPRTLNAISCLNELAAEKK